MHLHFLYSAPPGLASGGLPRVAREMDPLVCPHTQTLGVKAKALREACFTHVWKSEFTLAGKTRVLTETVSRQGSCTPSTWGPGGLGPELHQSTASVCSNASG